MTATPHTVQGRTFETWLSDVDTELLAIAGLTHRDLADQTWWDWWADELSPAEAAELTLEDEGFPFE